MCLRAPELHHWESSRFPTVCGRLIILCMFQGIVDMKSPRRPVEEDAPPPGDGKVRTLYQSDLGSDSALRQAFLGGIIDAMFCAIAGLVAIANIPRPSAGLVRAFSLANAAALTSLISSLAMLPGFAGFQSRWFFRVSTLGFLTVAALFAAAGWWPLVLPPLFLAASALGWQPWDEKIEPN